MLTLSLVCERQGREHLCAPCHPTKDSAGERRLTRRPLTPSTLLIGSQGAHLYRLRHLHPCPHPTPSRGSLFKFLRPGRFLPSATWMFPIQSGTPLTGPDVCPLSSHNSLFGERYPGGEAYKTQRHSFIHSFIHRMTDTCQIPPLVSGTQG